MHKDALTSVIFSIFLKSFWITIHKKFPALFIKFNGNTLSETILIFKSGKINSVGIKRPKQFLELDKWIKSNIHYV